MTRLPLRPPIPPEQALLFVLQIRELFTVVALDEAEYFGTVERIADQGLAKSYIYDAMIASAAQKSGASAIYTWNVDHFRRVAPPAVAARIQTPG
jgi:predicted nucleic acid-binding protein